MRRRRCRHKEGAKKELSPPLDILVLSFSLLFLRETFKIFDWSFDGSFPISPWIFKPLKGDFPKGPPFPAVSQPTNQPGWMVPVNLPRLWRRRWSLFPFLPITHRGERGRRRRREKAPPPTSLLFCRLLTLPPSKVRKDIRQGKLDDVKM